MSRTREKIIAKSIIQYFDDEGGSLSLGINQTIDHISNKRHDPESADFLVGIIDKPIVTKDQTFDLSGKYKGGALTLFVINILTNELSKALESKEDQMALSAANRVKEIFNLFKENIMNYILFAEKEYDRIAVKAVLSKLETSLNSFEDPNIFDAYDLILETQDKLKPLLYNIEYDKKSDKIKSSQAKLPENNPQKVAKLKQLASELDENPLSDEKFKGKFVKNYAKLLEKLDRYQREGLVSSAYCTSFKEFCEKLFKEKYERIIAEQERQIAPKKTGFSLLQILRVKDKKREQPHFLSPGLSPPPGLLPIDDGLTSPSLASPPSSILSAKSKNSSSPEEQQNPSPPSLSSTTSPSEGSDLPHSVSKSPSPVEKKEPVPASARAAVAASGQGERRRSLAGRFHTDRQLGLDGRVIFSADVSLFDKFNLHDEDDEENDHHSKKKPGLSRSSDDSD